MNRRQLIRIGAASVDRLRCARSVASRAGAERPGLSRPCLRVPVRRERFEQHRVPMDDTNYKAYTSIRGSLALSGGNLTPTVTSVSGAPYAFHAKLAEVASMFSTKELAVVANVGSLVEPLTRAQYQAQQMAIPLNLFSHADQQLQWQTSIAQGNSSTGWGGRAADYIAAEKINSSSFPTFFSVAGNALKAAGEYTAGRARPGQSLTLAGFNLDHRFTGHLTSLKNLLTLGSGVSLVQAADDTMSASIGDATALTPRSPRRRR